MTIQDHSVDTAASRPVIYKKVARGSLWVLLVRLVQAAVSTLKWVILAWFLLPQEMGIIGIASLTLGMIDTLTQTGLQAALIQHKQDIQSNLDSVWTIGILRGIGLFGLCFVTAPIIARYFSSPLSEEVIRVLGIRFLLLVLVNVGIIYFQKDLKFYKYFIYQVSGTFVDFAAVIVAAILCRNVWALVIGILSAGLVQCLISYLIHPYRPRLKWSGQRLKELWGFGRWIFSINIVHFLIEHLDDIFVGRMLGTHLLGVYQMGYRIAIMPGTEITQVVSQVTFPAYSKISHDIPRLKEAYLQVLRMTTFLAFPITALLWLFAYDFVSLFMPPRWLTLVPIIQILVFQGLQRCIFANASPLFYAVGRPRIQFYLASGRLAMIMVLIYPMIQKYGVLGACWAILLSGLAMKIVTIPVMLRQANITFGEFYHQVASSGLATILMGAGIYGVRYLLCTADGKAMTVWIFFLLVFSGLLIYLGLGFLFNPIIKEEVKGLVGVLAGRSASL